MNLNQKFKNHFLAASSLPLSGEAVSFFDEVAKTYLQNFKPSYGAGFNHEQIDLITEKSATLWAEKFKLLANDTSLDQTTVLRKAWQEVVTDFHRNNQWN